jgi:hypothetical protein
VLPPNPFVQRWATTLPTDSREEAHAKEVAFQKAQKISREIDEKLSESKKVMEKKRKAAQILLLGASTETPSIFFGAEQMPVTAPRTVRVRKGKYNLVFSPS